MAPLPKKGTVPLSYTSRHSHESLHSCSIIVNVLDFMSLSSESGANIGNIFCFTKLCNVKVLD